MSEHREEGIAKVSGNMLVYVRLDYIVIGWFGIS